MNRYVLNIIQPSDVPPDPEVLGPIMAEVGALMYELESSGNLVMNSGLEPADAATVITTEDGKSVTTDGAFVETKEHIGGFVIITADSKEDAVEWGRKLSRAVTLPIEVRGFAQHPGA